MEGAEFPQTPLDEDGETNRETSYDRDCWWQYFFHAYPKILIRDSSTVFIAPPFLNGGHIFCKLVHILCKLFKGWAVVVPPFLPILSSVIHDTKVFECNLVDTKQDGYRYRRRPACYLKVSNALRVSR